ncbi:MAG: LptF/LptG family permease [Planctomycetota bacterium]
MTTPESSDRRLSAPRPGSRRKKKVVRRSRAGRGSSERVRPDVGRRPLPLFGRLDRYVVLHFVQSYLTAMLLMTGLFMVIDMASNLDDYLEAWDDGTTVPASVLARYYVLNLPYLFLQVGPFVTLIAGMFTVSKMLKAREVTAILGAGVSARRMLVPLFLAGTGLALGMFGLREALGYGVAEARDSLRFVLEEQRFDERYDSLAVLEEGGATVLMESFYPGNESDPPRIEGLTTILRRDSDRGVTKYIRVDAPSAVWNGETWDLTDGVRKIIDLDEPSRQLSREPVDRLDGYRFTPEVALTFRRAYDAPLELSFGEVRELMARDPSDTSYQTLWHYHLTFPLANVILLLVGIPLMFTYERGKGTDRIAVGGLLCVFYYAADFVFRTLGIKGQLSPLLSAWIPVLVFGAIGVMLYDSLRS